MPQPGRWDIFCTVIDNYGDIGITWRLARQLAQEHGLQVRLWVDDLASFQRIRPEVDPGLETQRQLGVEVRRWRPEFPAVEPAEVVIEALACHLPEPYQQAMAAASPRPVWVNLEYLSAEDWVRGCHTLPSPHPRLPLTKHFFMPGYDMGTGGVLKEAWLTAERDAFQADRDARNAFWKTLNVPAEAGSDTRVSLFSYESRAIGGLFQTWSDGADPMRCLVPQGKALANVSDFFGRANPGDILCRGNLSVHVLPMLDLDGYDRLLWACDCNFVRGEDSFVRAQWAGKPLIWQAYRQQEEAHWPKIDAFLARYCTGMDAASASALWDLWRRWNEDGEAGSAWPAFWRERAQIQARAAGWQTELDKVGDLAGNLVKFCNEKSK